MSQSTTIAPALEVAAADSSSALNHFEGLLRFETDCWDVHASLAQANPGFVLLDVRSPDDYAKGHVPGAINLPHRRITELNLAGYPLMRCLSCTARARTAMVPTKPPFAWLV